MSTGMTYEEKRKEYFKVLWILVVLTTIEVAAVKMPSLGKLIQTSVIVLSSLAKAFYVGWVYMHLNHESKALRSILMIPLAIVFLYSVALVWDAPGRKAHAYESEQPERIFGPRNLQEQKRNFFGEPIKEDLKKSSESDSEHGNH